MSTKDDFTPEEWKMLLGAPMVAGMSIISSDVGITSVFKETAAMVKAISNNPVPAGAEDVVNELVADIKAMADNHEKIEPPEFTAKDPAGVQAEISAQLHDVALLADNKLSAEASAAYKEWVYSVAYSVAEAGKEGGFLGIGAVKVSEQEKEALASLRADLGLA
jgi:hypothetical protein